MTTRFTGACLCNGVQFSVTGFNNQVANCHCTMCRKFHGAAFGTLVGVTGLTWLAGNALLTEYVAGNGTIRTFCSCCGSSIGFRVANSTLTDIELAISLFSTDIPVVVDAQIFTRYKANWCKLADDVPVFAEGRDS